MLVQLWVAQIKLKTAAVDICQEANIWSKEMWVQALIIAHLYLKYTNDFKYSKSNMRRRNRPSTTCRCPFSATHNTFYLLHQRKRYTFMAKIAHHNHGPQISEWTGHEFCLEQRVDAHTHTHRHTHTDTPTHRHTHTHTHTPTHTVVNNAFFLEYIADDGHESWSLEWINYITLTWYHPACRVFKFFFARGCYGFCDGGKATLNRFSCERQRNPPNSSPDLNNGVCS